jgi:hypothetical protein
MPKTADTTLRRADAARQIMQNGAVAGALEIAERAILDRFKKATTPDEAWMAHCDWVAREGFIALLHAFVSEGDYAAKAMAEETDRLRRDAVTAEETERYNRQAALARAEWNASKQAEDIKESDTDE